MLLLLLLQSPMHSYKFTLLIVRYDAIMPLTANHIVIIVLT